MMEENVAFTDSDQKYSKEESIEGHCLDGQLLIKGNPPSKGCVTDDVAPTVCQSTPGDNETDDEILPKHQTTLDNMVGKKTTSKLQPTQTDNTTDAKITPRQQPIVKDDVSGEKITPKRRTTVRDRLTDDEITPKRQAALELMKPLCTCLMQERTVGNVQAVLNALPSVDDSVLSQIQIYVLFPVKTVLGSKDFVHHGSDSMFLALCQVIEGVYMKSQVADDREVLDVISLLLLYMAPLGHTNRITQISEDSKTAMCNAIKSVLLALPKKSFHKFYQKTSIPALGQLISISLQVAEYERSKTTQVAALACLKVLYFGDPDEFTCEEAECIGSCLAFCLPAVTTATLRVITGDSKQGHKVFVEAVNLLTIAVYRAMGKKVYDMANQNSKKLQQQRDALKGDPLEGVLVVQDMSWLQQTAEKLKILIEKLCTVRAHTHHKARASLADLGCLLLTHCLQSLSAVVPVAIDLLVGFLADSHPQVSHKAALALQLFAKDNGGHKTLLVQTLQDNLYKLCTALPRQMRMADEEDKVANIKLLRGYLTLLGPDVQCVLLSQAHLKRVCLALVQSLDLDTSDIQILEERNSLLHQDRDLFQDKTAEYKVWRRKKQFKHISDPEVVSELLHVCRLLGQYGDLAILVDFFLELYHESSVYQLASVLIINEMVLGVSEAESSEHIIDSTAAKLPPDLHQLKDLIELLLDEYLSSENLSLLGQSDESSQATHVARTSSSSSLTSSSSSLLLPMSSSPFTFSTKSSAVVLASPESFEPKKQLLQRNRAIALICLFMEGIGNFAVALGPAFEVYLIRALYPLVEHLGHENIQLSSTAYLTLTQICQSCDYKSLDELLQKNADYLVSSVTLRMRHILRNRCCPQTLVVMMRYCSSSLLPRVEHSILQLLDTLDDNYTEEVLLFLPALQELASAIGRWFPSQSQDQVKKKSSPNRPDKLDPESIVAYVREYVQLKRVAEFDVSGEDPGGGGDHERQMKDIEADMRKFMVEQEVERERQEEAAILEEEHEQEKEKEKEKDCPRHIKLTKEILLRVKHFLSSEDGRLRVKSLDILSQCVANLKEHQKELLPQIHQFWSSFCPLFRCQEKYVVIKALVVLRLISDVAGDFVRQRIMKNVVPGLVEFMQKQAKISTFSGSSYVLTSNYKLQLATLQNLGPIAENLCLDSGDLDSCAHAVIPYLCDKQPKSLQQACLETFPCYIRLDPDAMWFALSSVYCPPMPPVPGPEFTPVKVFVTTGQKNSSTTNVQYLFDTFYS